MDMYLAKTSLDFLFHTPMYIAGEIFQNRVTYVRTCTCTYIAYNIIILKCRRLAGCLVWVCSAHDASLLSQIGTGGATELNSSSRLARSKSRSIFGDVVHAPHRTLDFSRPPGFSVPKRRGGTDASQGMGDDLGCSLD